MHGMELQWERTYLAPLPVPVFWCGYTPGSPKRRPASNVYAVSPSLRLRLILRSCPELNDADKAILIELLRETIERDRFPLSRPKP